MFRVIDLNNLVSEFVGYEVKSVEVWDKVMFVVGKSGGKFVSKKSFGEYWDGNKFGIYSVVVRGKGFDVKKLVGKVVKERGWNVGNNVGKVINERVKIMGELVVYRDASLSVSKLSLEKYVMIEINSVVNNEKRNVVVFVI
jgi:hypothetical protein